jgi:hypothetical protein
MRLKTRETPWSAVEIVPARGDTCKESRYESGIRIHKIVMAAL